MANKHQPFPGELRIVRRLLLWPRKVQGKWGWLRMCSVLQIYEVTHVNPPDMPRGCDVGWWRSYSWLWID